LSFYVYVLLFSFGTTLFDCIWITTRISCSLISVHFIFRVCAHVILYWDIN